MTAETRKAVREALHEVMLYFAGEHHPGHPTVKQCEDALTLLDADSGEAETMAELKAEVLEQARLLGMSGSREAALRARIAELEAGRADSGEGEAARLAALVLEWNNQSDEECPAGCNDDCPACKMVACAAAMSTAAPSQEASTKEGEREKHWKQGALAAIMRLTPGDQLWMDTQSDQVVNTLRREAAAPPAPAAPADSEEEWERAAQNGQAQLQALSESDLAAPAAKKGDE